LTAASLGGLIAEETPAIRSDRLATHKRVSKRIPFRTRLRYGADESLSPGYSVDLSEHGMGIVGKHLYPPKSSVRIEVLMKDFSFTINAEVKHAKKFLPGQPVRMGVAFQKSPAIIRALYKNRSAGTTKKKIG